MYKAKRKEFWNNAKSQKKETTHMATQGKKSWRYSLANTEVSQNQGLNNKEKYVITQMAVSTEIGKG